jgi:putative transposase
MKTHYLAKSITDAGWSEFVRQCQYKGGWYGCYIEQVGRFFPSSKLCSVCGKKHQSLRLSDRKWVCAGCGTVHHRDENACINILVEGLRIVSQHTAGAAGINAGGEAVRPILASASPAVSAKPEAQLL